MSDNEKIDNILNKKGNKPNKANDKDIIILDEELNENKAVKKEIEMELEIEDLDIDNNRINPIEINQIEKDQNQNQIHDKSIDINSNSNSDKNYDININKSGSKNQNKKEKEKPIKKFYLLDTIIDETGITWYNMRIYLILSLFLMADGAEMIVLSLLIKQLGEIWNLSDSQKGFTGSAVFIGFFIGALFAGKLSDLYGRKPVFITGALIVSIFSLSSAFALDFITFLILRAINGFGIGLSIPSSSSLAVEITSSKWRSWVMNLIWIFFPVGEVLVSIIASSFLKRENGWRYLLAFAAIPSIISAIISFFIYESPRFYFATRNYEKAFIGLERMVKNRKIMLGNNPHSNSNFQNNQNNLDNLDNLNNQNKQNKLHNDIEMEEKNVQISYSFNNNNNSDDKQNEIKKSNENININNDNSINNNINNPIIMNMNLNMNNSFMDYNSPEVNPYEGKLDNFFTLNNELNEEAKKFIKRENEREGEEIIKPEFKTLLKKKYLYLTILSCLIFLICSFIYYGVIYILPQTIIGTKSVNENLNVNLTNLNSTIFNNTYITSNLTENQIKNQKLIEEDNDKMFRGVIISAISEVPATFLTGYIGNIPLLGRKGSMIFGFILAGISALLCSIYMNNLIIFATALKFSISIPFGLIYVYVSEAFPTKIRTISLGVTNSFNRIGGILTPVISQLAFASNPNDPYKLYGIMAFLGAFISYLLPYETLGRIIK